MTSLYTRFKNVIDHHQLLEPDDTIIAAVSGGVDSIVLLDLLFRLKKDRNYNFKLIAAHLNHSTRNGASDLDQNLVKKFCSSRSIILKTRKVNISHKVKNCNKSFEMVARDVRYDFFANIAENAKIATGHTLDDHVETLLLRIFKGAGMPGLCGIAYQSDNVIHPLRFAKKSELYEYASTNALNYNEDKTNYENTCDRNIIRNNILPEIEKNLNPDYYSALDRLSKIARETDNFLLQQSQKYLVELSVQLTSWYQSLKLDGLKELHDALIKKIILVVCNRLIPHSTIEYTYYQQLLEQLKHESQGQLLKINSNLAANFDRDCLIIYNKKAQDWQESRIKINENISTKSFYFSSQIVKDWSRNKSPNIEFIDYNKISGNLKLRHWRKGDIFQPVNFAHSKKLSDFFIDNKIPKFKKHQVPILTDDDYIIWICGHRLSDKYKIDDRTDRVVRLEYREK